MKTYKTDPVQDAMPSKRCKRLRETPDNVDLKYEGQPLCILDIRYGKRRDSFEFVVSINGLYESQSPEIVMRDLEDLSLEYKIWLLSKFKANMRSLGLIDRLKGWVLDRLSLLKEYCEIHDISIDMLNVTSAQPPATKTSNQTSKVGSSNTDDKLKYTAESNIRRAPKIKKRKTLSLDANTMVNTTRFGLSKTARLRAIYSQVKIMLAKYKTRKSIEKKGFLEELECLNAYIYDL